MPKSIRTIVVGVALVDELDPVLPSAVRLANTIGAELHIVHVFDLPEPIMAAWTDVGSTGEAGPAWLRAHAKAIEEALRKQCARFAVAPDHIHAFVGSAHDRLTRYAAGVSADLVVVGATRRGRIWRSILGTTAERVLQRTTVPVLVLHQPFFHAVRRVLLTTDLTGLSAEVHERALDVVENLFGGLPEVRSLFVLPGPPLQSWGSPDEIEDIGRAELADFIAERQQRSYAVWPRVRAGDASTEINVEADASGSDLIVLGTHGRSGIARYVFGSVAAATLRDASRNVLVVPAQAEAPVTAALSERVRSMAV